MKIKYSLLALASFCVITSQAQIMITENFNNPSTISSQSGWVKQNLSNPQGINSWFTGNPGVFPAMSGPDSAYIAANYNNTTGNSGTISNWLITPTVTVNDGGILQFATRTNTAAPQSVAPDRLQVYMSLGTGTNVGNTSTSLGTFTTLLVTVNPSLTPTGYPTVWTVYTTTLSGITGTNTARFGFRYFVTSAGPTGTNSSYIGIDNVKYDLPCPNPTLTISSSSTGICSGNTFSIGASGATTYTWSSGQNTPSVTLNPTVSTVYTLTASSIPNCNSTGTVAVTVTLTPNLSVPNVTTCPGTAATIAASGATSYSWSTGSTSATIVDTPTANTVYTVTGFNGNCAASSTVSATLGSSLSINVLSVQSLICAGTAATLNVAGASSYSYSSATFTSLVHTASVTLSPTVNTVYMISGTSGSCVGTSTILVNVNPAPVISIVPSGAATVCVNSGLSFTASGAPTYTWSNGSQSSILNILAPSTSTTMTYSVVGTGTNGCSSSTFVTRNVSACTGIESLAAATEKLSAYPNPFGNELKISGNAGRIEIYNALGEMVMAEAANENAAINTSALSRGIYILKAYNDDEMLVGTVKLIKN